MRRSVKETAEFVHAHVVGDGGVGLSGIASVSSASAGDLVFVEDEKDLATALASHATAVMAGNFAAWLHEFHPHDVAIRLIERHVSATEPSLEIEALGQLETTR